MAAKAASTTMSYSEPVVDGLFPMEGKKKTIALLIRKECEIKNDLARNESDTAKTEISGIIGIPVPRSPGASDHLEWVVLTW